MKERCVERVKNNFPSFCLSFLFPIHCIEHEWRKWAAIEANSIYSSTYGRLPDDQKYYLLCKRFSLGVYWAKNTRHVVLLHSSYKGWRKKEEKKVFADRVSLLGSKTKKKNIWWWQSWKNSLFSIQSIETGRKRPSNSMRMKLRLQNLHQNSVCLRSIVMYKYSNVWNIGHILDKKKVVSLTSLTRVVSFIKRHTLESKCILAYSTYVGVKRDWFFFLPCVCIDLYDMYSSSSSCVPLYLTWHDPPPIDPKIGVRYATCMLNFFSSTMYVFYKL